MKRLFAFSFLMATFVMNAVAWEPVIKERHWFGMHEFYSSPILGVTTDDITGGYIKNKDFNGLHEVTKAINNESSTVTMNMPKDWTDNGTYYGGCGVGEIGTCKVDYNWHQQDHEVLLSDASSSTDDTHKDSEFCIGIEARWANNSMSFSQQVNLPAGHYTLSFDVQNRNSNTLESTTTDYNDLFYVKVGDVEYREAYTNYQASWMKYDNGNWETHTIDFDVDQSQLVTISLGYGVINKSKKVGGDNIDFDHSTTPLLFVSHLKLALRDNNGDAISRINFKDQSINEETRHFIESITVIKDWTGQVPLQQPKTSYYSWLDHKLRFSVNVPGNWGLGTNNNATYNGLGLKNISQDATNFVIHGLKQGDQFNIEYYHPTSSPSLVSGQVDDLTQGSDIDVYEAAGNQLKFYTMSADGNSADGNVEINIPSGTVIRSVTIQHAQYKKATSKVTKLTVEEVAALAPGVNTEGYRYSVTGSGVLENKRGAVPYITMRFGADNDMTFVRDLGSDNGSDNGSHNYAASNIIDETNNFEPGSLNPENPGADAAQLQLPYRSMSEPYLKNWLGEKEWSVFTTNLIYKKKNNSEEYETDEQGNKIVIEDFSTIYPLYGSYYYFFPEVNGVLKMRFFCEGSEETPAFWYKQQEVNGVTTLKDYSPSVTKIGLNNNYRTSGGNYYDYTVNVEKGGVYYLCSLPTNINHEHPIIRLVSYEFVPTFHVAPLYMVVDNGTTEVKQGETTVAAATIEGVTIDQFTGLSPEEGGDAIQYTSRKLDNSAKITINGEKAQRVKFLGNVTGADVMLRKEGNDIKLEFENITYKTGTNINKGGAIVVNLDCPAGKATYVLTVAYKAADAKWGKVDNKDARVAATDGGEEVKRWDFYSTPLKIGKYSEGSGTYPTEDWKNSSALYKEVHKADGLTADWVKTYMNLKDNSEPIFKSVYDMVGDNADMLEETEGLIFITHSNQLGIYNENPVSDSEHFQDRYIGLMTGGQLIIPKLKEGDRVVIKMGRYGTTSYDTENQYSLACLHFENAQDAIGQDLSSGNTLSDYVIGGSAKNNTGDQSQPHGEYHFISKGGDFIMTVDDASLVKIYSIEIYRHDNTILTENRVLGNNREILYTDKDKGGRPISLQLHYHGLGEKTALTTSNKTGKFSSVNLTSEGDGSIYTPDDYVHTFNPALTNTAESALFGTFTTRIAVKTKDGGQNFVTDYADHMVAVGYRQTKTYPYTWDFTDLKKYVTGTLDKDGSEAVATGAPKMWNNYGLQVRSENTEGCIFVSGSQLYAGTTMFPETAGIGIYHVNNDKKRNNVMTITGDGETESGGLQVNDNNASGDKPLFWEYLVPSVKAKQAVYAHAKKASGANTSQAKYALSINCLNPEKTEEHFVPLGWECVQGNAEGDVHQPGKNYSSILGSRLLKGFNAYQGAGLYWRNGTAKYSRYLTPGAYKLTFAMIAWHEPDEPCYDVTVSVGNSEIVKSSEFTAAPNVGQGKNVDASKVVKRELEFDVPTEAIYDITFTDKSTTGVLREFVLLQCELTTPEQNFDYSLVSDDGKGDAIYAMMVPNRVPYIEENITESDVKLCFQGYEVNKIAVSTEKEHKNLNVKGWATESRDHDIDASLTSYMTGKDIKTYIVTAVDAEGRKATLTDVSDKRMPSADSDGNQNACILFNNTDKGPLDVFGVNSGFHLFVPDMHDTGKEIPTMDNNMLKAKLNPGVMSVGEGGTVNYVFTYQYVKIDPKTGEVISGERQNEDMAFYRLGSQRPVTSIGNQAYLPVSADNASRSILFYLDFAGDDGDATAIDALQSTESMHTEQPLRYYNLNGQLLDSKPVRSGVYVVNGKKVFIK